MGCVYSKNAHDGFVLNGLRRANSNRTAQGQLKRCPECRQPYTQASGLRGWCQPCEAQRFYNDLGNWTSGNLDLDRIISETQLNSPGPLLFLEWLPYDKFTNVQEIGRGEFSAVYSASWNPGPKVVWDERRRQWVREGETRVVLKRLFNSQQADNTYWSEVERHRCPQSSYVPRWYGFSQDPTTHDYVIVMQLADGDLRRYLCDNWNDLTWEKRLGITYNVAHGLMDAHNAGRLHRNLHGGNILRYFNGSQCLTYITDLAQHRPADAAPNT